MALPVSFPVVAIGASAGGVDALWSLLSALPPRLEAAILVVTHIAPHADTHLDRVLGQRSALPVQKARDGEQLLPGRVYVPQADRHLMIDGEVVRVTHGPKECRVRPAINVLFRSVAESCGARAIGVVLSGLLDDGTAGLWTIKQRGGRAFVQQPEDAVYDSMPLSALEHVEADAVAPAGALAASIAGAVREAALAPGPVVSGLGVESLIASGQSGMRDAAMQLGRPSRFACPECHGVLGEIREGSIVRFRCHTGHAYTTQTLAADLDRSIEESLWSTLRALEEKQMLLEAAGAGAAGSPLGDELQRVMQRLDVLRAMVLDPDGGQSSSQGISPASA